MKKRNILSRRDLLKAGMVAGGGLIGANLMSFIQYRRAHAQDQPIRAAMSSAGLAGTWNAQGQEAALYWADLLGVEVTWFDGEFDPAAQRAKFDQIATEAWDFVAVQPNTLVADVEQCPSLSDSGTA